MFDLHELGRAAELVHAHMPATPQRTWPLLDQRSGCEVWVKHENHTPVGAFKVRGGIVLQDDLARRREDGESITGVISATRGNHGQSLAWAGRRFGVPVVVVVPHGNAVEKNAAMRALGAELVEHGEDFDAALDHARQLAAERGLLMVSAFDPRLVRGVATYALELLSAAPPLDAVYVPLGSGTGAAGLALTRDLLGLDTQIVGVTSTETDAWVRSIEQGRAVESLSATTFVDGVAVRRPPPEAVDLLAGALARVVTVSDAQVASAMRAYHSDTHNLAEPAGAAPLAALLADAGRHAGRRVGVVLCGANVDASVYATVLAGEVPLP